MNYQLINDEGISNNQSTKKKYDLEERTGSFGEKIVHFTRKIRETWITRSLISQLIRAGTSVGANYCEADDAHSKKDFIHKLGICRKESRETKHWLTMMIAACPDLKGDALGLRQEAHELNLIFSSIINKLRKKMK